MFNNREEAGKLLGAKVLESLATIPNFQATNTVVIGLPRGGVPVAKEVASALGTDLTILVSKKIGAPLQPELAIGAVCSSGVVVLNTTLGYIIDDLKPYIESEKNRLIAATKELEKKWTEAVGIQDHTTVKGKIAILVDDGIATGMTTLAAIRSLKQVGAKWVIVASPIVSAHVMRQLKEECDGIISLIYPYDFQAIGQFYRDFRQVEDQEMLNILKHYKNANVSAA